MSMPFAVPTGTPTVSMSFQAKTTPSRSVRNESRLGRNPKTAESGTASADPKTMYAPNATAVVISSPKRRCALRTAIPSPSSTPPRPATM
ncbi:hypothetical protein D3C73_1526750 [compost metagenome]